MTVKKVPLRTCVACMTTKPKRDLVRIVRTVDGTLLIDQRGKVSGRGAYLCPRDECVQSALKSHRLERALKVELSPDMIEALQHLEGGLA